MWDITLGKKVRIFTAVFSSLPLQNQQRSEILELRYVPCYFNITPLCYCIVWSFKKKAQIIKIFMHLLSMLFLCCSAVGTFARALDCSSSVRQPSLHMSAAAASRDITLVGGLLKTLQLFYICDFSSVFLIWSLCPLDV